MPFLDYEQSNYNGSPTYLFEFRRGNLREYLSGGDEDVQAGAILFKSTPVTVSTFTQKGEAITDVITLDMPDTTMMGTWFRYTAPSDTVYVVIRRYHKGDPQSVVAWIGSVVSVNNAERGKITVTCQPVAISLSRSGLRMTWQRGCQHALYDNQCTLNRDDYKVSTTITNINAPIITTAQPGLVGHWYAGGVIEWLVGDDTYERRLIETFNGNTFVPYGNLDGFQVGLAVNLYPGCLRTSIWCDQVFANLDNYGGFPYMPNRTLYDGDPVF